MGVPIGVKDNFNVAEMPTTCASHILESEFVFGSNFIDYVSPYDATVCRRILDDQGIIIGKTNMDEFGMGSMNTFSNFGPTKNPLSSKDDSLVPGGSSGGSAAAVASYMCYGFVNVFKR